MGFMPSARRRTVEPSSSLIGSKRDAVIVVVDFKGEAARPDRVWVTTREQAFDHENTSFHESAVKTKGLVSAEGIELEPFCGRLSPQAKS